MTNSSARYIIKKGRSYLISKINDTADFMQVSVPLETQAHLVWCQIPAFLPSQV